jgi:hypothetical protein
MDTVNQGGVQRDFIQIISHHGIRPVISDIGHASRGLVWLSDRLGPRVERGNRLKPNVQAEISHG